MLRIFFEPNRWAWLGLCSRFLGATLPLKGSKRVWQMRICRKEVFEEAVQGFPPN